MKEHLAIFDLDGTLFDTVPANYAAYNAVLCNYGISISQEYFAAHCNGRYYRDFLSELVGQDTAQMEAIHREKIALYPSFFSEIRENGALFDLIKALAPTYHIALVTTAANPSVFAILKHFRRTDAFELILTQQEVPKKKPAPDGFFMAMNHFGIPAKRTIIFEDSPEGIAAAKACGAAYFIVRDIL